MKLSVIGTGYLGAVHAAAMASLGFDVVGVDVDPGRIDRLRAGSAPFDEPEFDALLAQVMATGHLTWSVDYADLADADFLCVGTPQRRGSHAADLRYVWDAVEALIPTCGRIRSSPASRRCPSARPRPSKVASAVRN